VAGINVLWRSSEASIAGCVRSSMDLVRKHEFRSVAFPVIGTGSGGMGEDRALAIMKSSLAQEEYDGRVLVVRFRKPTGSEHR
jgi:O-acetyl-ADP-ribose deacetylase